MTPEQYLVSQLTVLISANNPQATSEEISAYCTQLASFYTQLILPNLSVNLTTGAVNFIVPSS